MLRHVLAPVEVRDEVTTYRVPVGATVATLLPLLNTTAAAELVTAFGHGSHTCPAQPFSLAAMSRTVLRLLSTLELRGDLDDAAPLPVQIGGVARAAAPCLVSYERAGARATA